MPKPRVSKAKRAQAAALVVVDGMDHTAAARVVGVSRMTVARAVEELPQDADLGEYVRRYRAKALPAWLSVVDAATARAQAALEKAPARDAAFVAKTYAELAQRAAGEPDQTHEHRGAIVARESLAARAAARVASARAGGVGGEPGGGGDGG